LQAICETKRTLLKEKEDEESSFYEEVATVGNGSKTAAAAGNDVEKRRLESIARLCGDQLTLAMAAAREA
jgi:hypothetical protein